MSTMYAVLRTAHSRFDEVEDALSLDGDLAVSGDLSDRARRIGWRRFVYSAAIVNIYGALEQFIDGLVENVADVSPLLYPTFDKVPQKLRESHDRQVRELLATEGKGRFERVEVDRLVLSLASCLQDSKNYKLSAKALSFHDANLRLPEIKKLLTRVNVDLVAVDKDKELLAMFGDEVLDGVYSDLDNLIHDIVERRNEISHGDYSDLLAVEVLRHITAILKRFATAVVEEVRRSLFKSVDRTPVGVVTNYMSRAGVHLLRLHADELKQSDLIFGMERGTKRICSLSIESMMDGGTQVDHIMRATMADKDEMVGLKLAPSYVIAGQVYTLPLAAGEVLTGPSQKVDM